MAELESGTLVRHASLGLGRVVALEAEAVHVFFPDSEKRFAAKLKLPFARRLLRTEGVGPDAWLEGLSAFTLDRKAGRYALAASWLTHDEAVALFLSAFPEGFAGPQGGRVACWRAAQASWAEAFGNGEGERLVGEGARAEIVRRMLRVEKTIASIQPSADAGAVKDALSHDETALPFCAALFELLSKPSPGRARFEKLFAAAGDLPVEPARQWLLATLFPFVASPGRQVLLRPRVTCEAAERLGFDIRFDASPNWATYTSLRAASAQLLENLRSKGARDFVDVESFLHVTATAKRRTKRRP